MASVAELDVLIRMQSQGQGILDALNGELIGVAVAAGAVYEVGKSVVDNYESQQKAARDLAQAFNTQGEAVPTKQIQAWLDANKSFVANQYDAEKAIGTATRAGVSWRDTQLLMNDALGLSIDRGISMSDAMDILTKAAEGGRVQLAYLGITAAQLKADTNAVADAQKAATKADQEKAVADRALQEELDKLHGKHTITQVDLDHLADLKAKDLAATQNDTKAQQDLAAAQAAVNAGGDRALVLHDLLAPKLAKETDTLTPLEQSQRRLNTDWQDFSERVGPGVVGVLDDITTAADTGVQILDEYVQIVEAVTKDPGRVAAAIRSQLPGFVQAMLPGAPPPPPAQPTWQVNNFTIPGSASPQQTAAAVSRVLRQAGSV